MYCGNCGTKIEDGITTCPKCKSSLNGDIPQSGAYKNEKSHTSYNGKDKLPLSICIALGIVSALFALFLAIVIYVYAFGGSVVGGIDLYCEELPVQTDKQSIVLSGTIKSSSGNATLTLNGQTIDTVSSGQREKNWSSSVNLKSGENIFVITLSDENGRAKSRVLYTEHQKDLVFSEGTVLNLTASGVYIRPTPNKSDKFIVMLWDTSTNLVCLGEESIDSEGYLWCKVNTPSNGPGWVRSDLVKVK